jgi:MFS family permease
VNELKTIYNDYKDFFYHIPGNIKRYMSILFFATILAAAYNIIFGIYLKNIGFTEDIVGQILSLKTFGIALGAVPVALLAQRFNKRRTLMIGLSIMVVSSFVLLNIKTLFIMQIFSLTFGIGHATTMILQGPIIYENTKEEHRVMAFSMAFVFQNLAFVFGSFVLGHISQYLSAIYGPSQGNLMVLNGATLLLPIGILIATRLKGTSMTTSNRDLPMLHDFVEVFKGYAGLLKGRTLKYLTQVALVGLGAGMIVPFFSIYLKFTLDVSDGVVGNIMAISQVGTIIGGLIVPPLAKRIGTVKTIIFCQLLSIPFLISISFPQGIIIVTISFFFRSSLMNMASPLFRSIAMEITTDKTRTHMSGMISFTNNLFRSLGIFIGGYIMYKFTYNTPYYLTIICYIIGTFIIYRYFLKDDYTNYKLDSDEKITATKKRQPNV